MIRNKKQFSGFRIQITIVLLAYLSPIYLWSQKIKKNDREQHNLLGHVQSFCETEYGYAGSIQTLKSITFDRLGRKIEEAEYQTQNQDQAGKMWKQKTYTYDTKGRLVREAIYVYGKIVELKSKTFNSRDQLVEEFSIPDESMRDGATGVRNYRTAHRYDLRGNRIESRFTKNDNTVPYAVWTFKFNEKNDVTESQKTENGRTELSKYLLTYDTRDSVTRKVEYRQSKPYQTWLFEYGPDGKLLSEIEYENTSSDSLKRPTKIKRYNNQQHVTEWVKLERSFRSDGPELISTRVLYFYDDKGRMISAKTFKSDQLASTETNRHEGEMTERMETTSEGRIQNMSCSMDGQLIERTEFKDDGSLFRRTAFEYDRYGNQINEFYWGADGQMVYRNGNYSLDYDSEGNWIQKNNNGRYTTVAARREFQYYPD